MSLTIKIHLSAVAAIMDRANEAGRPHQWVQIDPDCSATTLQWEEDGSPTGLRMDLRQDGTWSATLDLP